LTSTILYFVERFQERPLTTLGVSPTDAFPHPVLLPRFRRDVRSFVPENIRQSVYSRYACGETPVVGFTSLKDAVDQVSDRIRTTHHPAYSYLYYPSLDAAAHHGGIESQQVQKELCLIDAEMDRLSRSLPPGGRLVISADHGHLTILDSDKTFLAPEDPLLEFLEFPPAGEPRVPLFHPKAGMKDAFALEFRRRFGDRFALLSTEETETLHLLGPNRISSETRTRIGTFLAVADTPIILLYGPPAHHRPEAAMRSYHGGLTPEEIRIPLIVA
jgi:hypothetical protein